MVFGLFKKKKKDQTGKSGEKILHLRISEINQETSDAVRIEFDLPDDGIEYLSGQFLTLLLTIEGQKVRRAYSLCTSPYLNEKPAVAVKRVENGVVSNFANDNFKVGDVIDLLHPIGNFTPSIKKENKRHLVLIGGGSGITPLMGILKSTLHVEKESSVSLIYANRDVDSIIFKDELEELQSSAAGRFNYIQSFDNPHEGWNGSSGILSIDQMKQLITGLKDWDKESTLYYVCGPQGLMDLTFEAFAALNIDPHRTFKESFVASTTTNEKTSKNGVSQVKIKYDGEEYEFEVPFGKSILETALSQNIDLPYSCQSGLCTACMGKCLEGEVDLSDAEALSEEERAEGFVLTCVGKPLTDRIEIEI